MKVQLPPRLVVQDPSQRDNQISASFPSAPFLEFSVDIMLRIPKTAIEFDEEMEFAVGMFNWPGQKIAFHDFYVEHHPAWSIPSRIVVHDMRGEWDVFAGTRQIKISDVAWVVPICAPLPKIDFSERPYVEIIDNREGTLLGEWVEYVRLQLAPPGKHGFPGEYFKDEEDEVIDRVIRYYEENRCEMW